MIPQLGAPGSAGGVPQQTTDGAAARAQRPDAPARTENSVRPETARAVEPPQPAEKATTLFAFDRRNLNPPDPNAPAGPPPAFEASILDRQREEALRPPDLREATIVGPDDPPAAPPPPVSSEIDVPRAEAVEGPRGLRDPGEEVAPEDDTVPEVVSAAPSARESDPGSTPGATRAEPAAEAPREADDGRRPYAVPPSAEQRAEREVATIRRLDTPYDTATVDVSR